LNYQIESKRLWWKMAFTCMSVRVECKEWKPKWFICILIHKHLEPFRIHYSNECFHIKEHLGGSDWENKSEWGKRKKLFGLRCMLLSVPPFMILIDVYWERRKSIIEQIKYLQVVCMFVRWGVNEPPEESSHSWHANHCSPRTMHRAVWMSWLDWLNHVRSSALKTVKGHVQWKGFYQSSIVSFLHISVSLCPWSVVNGWFLGGH